MTRKPVLLVLLLLAPACAPPRPGEPPKEIHFGMSYKEAEPLLRKRLPCRGERNAEQHCNRLDCTLVDGGMLYAFGDTGGLRWTSRTRIWESGPEAETRWQALHDAANHHYGASRSCGGATLDCTEWPIVPGTSYTLLRMTDGRMHVVESMGETQSLQPAQKMECRPNIR